MTVRAAAERCERQAAPDDLPQDGQVRRDAEELLRAAAGHPETCDDLVEHEEGSRRVAEAAKSFEKAGSRRDGRPCSLQWARR